MLRPEELDRELRWPAGRSERLARQRRLPYVLLPDGAIRFDLDTIRKLVVNVPATSSEQTPEGGAHDAS